MVSAAATATAQVLSSRASPAAERVYAGRIIPRPGLPLELEDKPEEANIDLLPESLEACNEQQWPEQQPQQPLLREAP